MRQWSWTIDFPFKKYLISSELTGIYLKRCAQLLTLSGQSMNSDHDVGK